MAQMGYTGDPHLDPGAGNVTDGSVDYHDWDWGETVDAPDPVQANCAGSTGCGCGGGDGGGTAECPDNDPGQSDETGYEILDG